MACHCPQICWYGAGAIFLRLNMISWATRVMNRVWARVVAGCSSPWALVCVFTWIITALHLFLLDVPSIRPSHTSLIDNQRKCTGLSYVRLLSGSSTVPPTVKCTAWWKLLSRSVSEMQPGQGGDKVLPAQDVAWSVALVRICSLADAVVHMPASQNSDLEVLIYRHLVRSIFAEAHRCISL